MSLVISEDQAICQIHRCGGFLSLKRFEDHLVEEQCVCIEDGRVGACVKQFSRLPGVMKTGALKGQLPSLRPVIGPPLYERTDRSGGNRGYQDK